MGDLLEKTFLWEDGKWFRVLLISRDGQDKLRKSSECRERPFADPEVLERALLMEDENGKPQLIPIPV